MGPAAEVISLKSDSDKHFILFAGWRKGKMLPSVRKVGLSRRLALFVEFPLRLPVF